MPSEAKKISDSVSVRDFDSEARTLQEQIAESERRLAAADDEIAAATEATLLRTAAAADAALERGDRAAEGTREKIHEQQERFKAGVVADGLSLDEPVEVKLGGVIEGRLRCAPNAGNPRDLDIKIDFDHAGVHAARSYRLR